MKITLVLPDGTRQPIEVSAEATLRRLLPALAAKISLPRRDDAGTAVAYYATYLNEPIADDQPLATLNLPVDAELVLHAVAIAEPHEAVEPTPEGQLNPAPKVPQGPGQSLARQPLARQPLARQRPSGSGARKLKVGCLILLLLACCLPVMLFSWLAYAISQGMREPQVTAVSPADYVQFSDHQWDFAVIDAAYSPALDQIIMLSANPHQLHIYDPHTGQDIQMALPYPPTALALAADGRLALAIQNNFLSFVDLATAQISQTLAMNDTIYDAAWAEDGWVYFTLKDADAGLLHGLELATELSYDIPLPHDNDLRMINMATDGRYLYSTTRGPQPSQLEKISISSGSLRFMYDSGGTVDSCGEVWLAANGRMAFTGCGHIWRLAEQRKDDMVLLGNFFTTPQPIISLAHSTITEQVLLITQANSNEILVFSEDGRYLLATRSLTAGANGRYLFLNAAGNSYYAITQNDTDQFTLMIGQP